MQTAYFLGSSTSNGFSTKFWGEQKNSYGYHLIGGPGTGKSTLLKKVASAFSDEEVSVYHCASDPDSLDAVVLEARGIYLADATSPHEQGIKLPYVTGQTVDLAAMLDYVPIRGQKERINQLQRVNLELHQQARYGITGISTMQNALWRIGKEAFLSEKAAAFAKRFAEKLFHGQSNVSCGAVPKYRQLSAFTPQGEVIYYPLHCDVIALHDDCGYASAEVIAMITKAASEKGIQAELTTNYFQSDARAMHVYFPAYHLMLQSGKADGVCSVNTIRMSRFYDESVLKKKRSYIRFCRKNIESLKVHTSEQLREALEVHDALEECYRQGLQYDQLDHLTVQLIADIKENHK